ncbi:MAG: TIR domain-containing protein [Paracoccaceae bacterium]
MSEHNVNVFISHSWTYSGHYDTLAEWIFKTNWSVGQASLNFRNYSVPKDDPIHNAPTDKALREAIYAKIARTHVIVIPTGMYTNYSKWIQKELDGADAYNKPVLGVNPWGQERKSTVVQQAAADTKGWNREPVIKAIWNLYRK